MFYVCFLGVSGYITSKLISYYLRRKNRLSYVEGSLLFLCIVAIINIPFALYLKYKNSNYDESVIFGFGSLC